MAGRVCSICTHAQRSTIDRLLADGTGSIRTIADRHGLSHQSLLRHRDCHLAAAALEQAEAQQIASDIDVMARLVSLDSRLERALVATERQQDWRALASVAGRQIALLELVSRLKSVVSDEMLRTLAASEGLDADEVVAAAQLLLATRT